MDNKEKLGKKSASTLAMMSVLMMSNDNFNFDPFATTVEVERVRVSDDKVRELMALAESDPTKTWDELSKEICKNDPIASNLSAAKRLAWRTELIRKTVKLFRKANEQLKQKEDTALVFTESNLHEGSDAENPSLENIKYEQETFDSSKVVLYKSPRGKVITFKG